MFMKKAQQAKEAAMAIDGKEGGGTDEERKYPTASHRLLGLTHGQLLDEMARRGESPTDALAFFDRMQAQLAERGLARASVGPKCVPKLVASRLNPHILARMPMLEERVSAGAAALPGGDTGLRAAELLDFFGSQNWGALVIARVSGSSMVGEHIQDGDAVLVDTRRRPRDGDIVLAHLAGFGQMVKRLRLDATGSATLESANPAIQPITVEDPSSLTVHGVVVARSGKL